MLDTILVSIITALATAAFAYLGFWRKAAAELRKELDSRFNEQKWKAYQDFMIMQSQFGNVMKPESAQTKIALLLTASDEVIRAYNDYVSLSFQKEKVEERHRKVGEMITEMRKDLGYDTKISNDELWKMFDSIAEK
jgi:hypothetical protein